jgi:hypothetical protein
VPHVSRANHVRDYHGRSGWYQVRDGACCVPGCLTQRRGADWLPHMLLHYALPVYACPHDCGYVISGTSHRMKNHFCSVAQKDVAVALPPPSGP